MTTPRISTHAESNTKWSLHVGKETFGPYRTAGEVKFIEERVRRLAHEQGWDSALRTVRAEQEGHRWKPLTRKPRSSTTRTTEETASPPQSNQEPPPPQPQATEPSPATPEAIQLQIGLPMAP